MGRGSEIIGNRRGRDGYMNRFLHKLAAADTLYDTNTCCTDEGEIQIEMMAGRSRVQIGTENGKPIL